MKCISVTAIFSLKKLTSIFLFLLCPVSHTKVKIKWSFKGGKPNIHLGSPPPPFPSTAFQCSIYKQFPTHCSVVCQFFNRLYVSEKEQDPPDCWDMELPGEPSSPQTAVLKPWRGAATLIPKVIPSTTRKQSADCKLVKYSQTFLLFSCHLQWRVKLGDLMTTIHYISIRMNLTEV